MYNVSDQLLLKIPGFPGQLLGVPRLVARKSKHICIVDIKIPEISSLWCLQLNNLK